MYTYELLNYRSQRTFKKKKNNNQSILSYRKKYLYYHVL